MFTAKFGQFPQYKPVLDKLAKYQQTHYGPGGKGTLANHYTTFGQSEGDFFASIYGLALRVVNGENRESKAFEQCAAKVDFTLQLANNMSEGYIGNNLPKATTTATRSCGSADADDSGGGEDSRQQDVAVFDSAQALVTAMIDKTLIQPVQDIATVKKNRASRLHNLITKKLFACVLVNYEYIGQVHSSDLHILFHDGVGDNSRVMENLRVFLQMGELHRDQVSNDMIKVFIGTPLTLFMNISSSYLPSSLILVFSHRILNPQE
jgi:hypothetical protein